jgi:hypothetical protein
MILVLNGGINGIIYYYHYGNINRCLLIKYTVYELYQKYIDT